MAVFKEDCRKRLQLCVSMKMEGNRRGLGIMKGKKLELSLMYKTKVLKNHTLSAINRMFMSPTKFMC